MSHTNTWDPKPGTGRDYLGELGTVMPSLAAAADKYALIRSIAHDNGNATVAYPECPKPEANINAAGIPEMWSPTRRELRCARPCR